MSGIAQLEAAVEDIQWKHVTRDQAIAVAEGLLAARNECGRDLISFEAVLRRNITHATWPIKFRRPIVQFLQSRHGNMQKVSKNLTGKFLGISAGSVNNDIRVLQSTPPSSAPSLGTALKRARPASAVENSGTPTRTAPVGVDVAASLRPALVAIGQSDDPRRYAGLVSEIGRVLTE